MKTMLLRTGCFVLLLTVSIGTARADIASNFGLGANALSMSGAYTGVADDFSACYYNPGGLAFQRRPVLIMIPATGAAFMSITLFSV